MRPVTAGLELLPLNTSTFMKRTKINDIFRGAADLVGKEVCVKGWVRTRRGNKHVQFVALNDGSRADRRRWTA